MATAAATPALMSASAILAFYHIAVPYSPHPSDTTATARTSPALPRQSSAKSLSPNSPHTAAPAAAGTATSIHCPAAVLSIHTAHLGSPSGNPRPLINITRKEGQRSAPSRTKHVRSPLKPSARSMTPLWHWPQSNLPAFRAGQALHRQALLLLSGFQKGIQSGPKRFFVASPDKSWSTCLLYSSGREWDHLQHCIIGRSQDVGTAKMHDRSL
ncbi:hypothetical protein WJX74_003571 [Apatococcus lobatus]|uniref:Uncharacterized protein n=1 Tax=Apatococcus lobatus TaxID=904363 RepID=A0AAW1RYR6_9CHLO